MRTNTSFRHKIEIAATENLRKRIERLNYIAACAGIKPAEGSESAAAKARMNHYGSFTKKVPARRWVDMADVNTARISEILDVQSLIKDLIKTPTEKASRRKEPIQGQYGVTFRYYDITPDVFPKGVGPVGAMKRVADGMLAAQRAAISFHEFRIGPTNGNDPTHNALSTIKNKGFDFPLVRSGEMVNSLSSWTEEA